MWNCLGNASSKSSDEPYSRRQGKRHSPKKEERKEARKEVDSQITPNVLHLKDNYNVELISSTDSINVDECFKPVTYGTLYVVGYNGTRQSKGTSRYQNKCSLEKREVPNGIKPFRQWTSKEVPKTIPGSYHCHMGSAGSNCFIEYQRDPSSDLFQVGRSAEPTIDFIVMDTIPGREAPDDILSSRSTISRFACHMIITRNRPFIAKLFSSGFDSSKSVQIGESCPKWSNEQGFQDGLTMNGVLQMNPRGAWGAQMKPGPWTEVSVMGKSFEVRSSRSSRERGKEASQSNVLCDGSLIDICGAVLMWRTNEGVKNSISVNEIVTKQEELNLLRPQCPVQLSTLRFNPHGKGDPTSLPHIYLKCGHVHGYHAWGIRPSIMNSQANKRQCPICRETGPFEKLKLGLEPAFYIDDGPLTHCFSPCGHITTEATVKYWSQVPISHGRDDFVPRCPFCFVPLSRENSYVKLMFQTET